jgi:GNAT superfamily N-acetyltransferase
MIGVATRYPRELEGTIRLRHDLELAVRPLQASDSGWIRELHRHLSPRTRYFQFFSLMPTVPEPLVTLLTSIDYHRALGLIAEARTPSAIEPVALASYRATEDDGAVEVSLVGRDEWQARGIGSALARRLLAAARARGFERFAAHLPLENVVGRRFVDRIGHVVSTHTRGAVSRVSFVAVERAGEVVP